MFFLTSLLCREKIVKLEFGCNFFLGAKLSALLCWCQIVLVPNCPFLLCWCQIVLVPNCPVPDCPGAKLSWCQIVRCQIVRCQIVLPPTIPLLLQLSLKNSLRKRWKIVMFARLTDWLSYQRKTLQPSSSCLDKLRSTCVGNDEFDHFYCVGDVIITKQWEMCAS